MSQLRELLDTLGISGSFDLIGTSQGGGTAVAFTATYPERVRRLVLISPVVRDFDVPCLFQVPIIGEIAARAFGMRLVAKRSQTLLEGSPEPDRYTALMNEQMRYRGLRASTLSLLRNDALGDYTLEYRAVGRQARAVLLLWGTADLEITRAMMDAARAEVPNVVFRSFDGLGHGILSQQPDLINHHLLEFLGGDKPKSR